MISDPTDNIASEDAALVRRICQDEEDAVEELLIDRCGQALNHLARRFNREDLLGDVYFHLRENDWRRLRTWEGRCSLKRWVEQVAVRICLHTLKESKRFRPLQEWEADLIEAATPSPAETAELQSRIMTLLNAIQGLESPRERILVTLHCVEERPIEEVANTLGTSVANAYVIKHRAIARLRTRLAEEINA